MNIYPTENIIIQNKLIIVFSQKINAAGRGAANGCVFIFIKGHKKRNRTRVRFPFLLNYSDASLLSTSSYDISRISVSSSKTNLKQKSS